MFKQFLFILFFSFLGCSVHAQLYTFKNFSHRDGIVTEATLCSQVGPKGYLWVGTDGGGIMRFDGKRFLEIQAGGNPTFHVSDIAPEFNETIYFSTLYDGIYRFKNNEYSFIYQPPTFDGECKRLCSVDSSLVLVTDRSIIVLSKGGKELRKRTFVNQEPIKVQQILTTPQGVFIFSNLGNFVVKNKRICTLSSWLGKKATLDDATFGSFSKNKIRFYHRFGEQCTEILFSPDGTIFKNRTFRTGFNLPNQERIKLVCERQNVLYICLENDELFKIDDNKLQYIVPNHGSKLSRIEGISIDFNSELWISNANGLFHVSMEIFTKIQLADFYNDKAISVISRTKNGVLILGNMKDDLYIGPLYSNKNPIRYNYRAFDVLECPIGTFIATDRGILKLNGSIPEKVKFPFQSNESISMLHWDGTYLWYAIKGKGLVKYTPETNKSERFANLNPTFPSHFYTAQNNFDESIVYFGSNNGILSYRKSNNQFTPIYAFKTLGTYCGNSTIDRFGTRWFTLDNGIAGITQREEYVKIDNPKKLPSTLFYTLSADEYGNLLVGTNRGINIIRVDENGNVIKNKNYSYTEGFGGYETHMRSVFQTQNYSYVGTIEGLYLINTSVLQHYPKPPAPLILFGRENEQGELITFDKRAYYTFKCLLPKSNGVNYSYRIKGFNNRWSDFSSVSEVFLPELSNGNYVLEVRASYDGSTYSDISSLPIQVKEALWKSKWFIVFLVILLALINLGYLEWSKSFATANLFDTRDVTVDAETIPRIILFGAVVNTAMLIIVDFLEPQYFHTFWYNIIFSSALFILFFYSRYIKNQKHSLRRLETTFYVAYAFFVVESYILVFNTNIHPFPLFFITMATMVVPFVIAKIRWVISICLIQLFVSVCMLIWLEDTIFNQILFVSMVSISGGLAVMMTYMRNSSLEKLIFVSGVINKGNVMAISFDQKGIITYCSNNIIQYLNISESNLIGKHISVLNPLVVSSEMRQISLDSEFEDGKLFLVPMINEQTKVVWIEWTCKFFNEHVRVIMGQDVTDKLTVSTNYRSLVEHAQDMIFNTDINGNFIFANERCVNQFGYRNEKIIGKPALSLIASDHRQRVTDFYVNQFQSRIQNTYLEFPIKSRDGRLFWVGQNVTMIFEPGSRKRVSGFIALARDITEKQANDLLIAQQNKDITSSINSAKRIQFNLLPKNQLLHERFNQSFVLYKPKDIVSGDFYWTKQLEEKQIIVLADCTGHGVPGAFMTIVGINLLNQLVRERQLSTPDEILNALNQELKRTLPKNDTGSYMDGMDVIIGVFEANKLTFATSGVGLIISKKEDYQFIKSTKNSNLEELHFESQTIELDSEDAVYFITDGYQKQFGSIRNKKFSLKRLQELILKITPESMSLQRKHFENALRNWSEGHEQTDDITLIGFRGYNLQKESVEINPPPSEP